MANSRLWRRPAALALLAVSVIAVAACSGPKPKGERGLISRNGKTSGKEYFSESAYGVKASPRVTNKLTNLPRGGGRDQTGRPYQVRGKWYYPKEQPGYKKVGGASWYGDAFHGRLTANGEIYDMTHLTAAHPTMPLPSYARVTNMKNGSSVIVRVNDRGPYADGRIIDLSRKAAELLDYTHDGVATVKVEYVGRARMDGRDEPYLMASYRQGNGAADPSDGMPTGVMIAMQGKTPSGARSQDILELPETAPALPEDLERRIALATMGYAQENAKSSPFSAIEGTRRSDWKGAKPSGEYIALGTFNSLKRAKAIAEKLGRFGAVAFDEGKGAVSLTLQPKQEDMDIALRAAWAAGARDAMTIRP